MDMRLGYPNHARESPLGDCATANAFPEVAQETMLQTFESHQKFPRAISGRNRVLGELPQQVLETRSPYN
jgi:hypothetical protein